MVLRNIFRRKVRSLLTLIGIALGLTVYISLSTISGSMKSEIQGIMLKYNIDVIVQPRGADPFIAARIADSEYRKLKELPGIKDIYPLITGYVTTPWNSHFFIFGVESIDAISGKFSLVEGRLLSEGKRELLLGSVIAQEFKYASQNKIVLADDEIYTISGVHHFGNRFADSAAILNLEDAQRVLKRGDNVNMVFINIQPGQNIDTFIAAVNRTFPTLQALRSANLTKESHIMSVIDFFVSMISSVSFIICAVIVMNTLFMNVTERTREIGILMAIGWGPVMIFRTIVLEAIIVCIAGGVAGIVLSKVILTVLAQQHLMSSGIITPEIGVATAVKALLIAVVLGIAGSAFPASVAARMVPAHALRFEQ
jgi:ABC-type antimicrobial peptide transport system permease subunit